MLLKYIPPSHSPHPAGTPPGKEQIPHIGLNSPIKKFVLSINFSSLGRTSRSPYLPLLTGLILLGSRMFTYIIVEKSI